MNDSISRQNAIEGVKELFACADIGNDERDIVYMLGNLPATDRPKGKWIEQDNGYFFCSKCGKYPEYQVSKTDFCPSCGADMM